MPVRVSEALSLAFFVSLTAAAWIRRLPADRRLQVTLGSAVMSAVVVAVARLDPWQVRDWAPAVSVFAGYVLAGRTFVDPMPGLEAWLLAWDRRIIGDPVVAFRGWPRPLLAWLDVAYVICFLLVPGGWAVLSAAGRTDLADYYWTIVAGAELGAFSFMPYLRARPPWVLERSVAAPLSAPFLRYATTGANTLPSGHAAAALAVTLAVAGAAPMAGAVLIVMALSVSLATIVVRAHYIVDVVTGLLLAFAIWAAASLAGV